MRACASSSASFGFFWPTSAGLDRRAHRVADRRPLRHARPPVDVGVVLERLQRRRDEVVARVLHRGGELGRRATATCG